MINYIVNKLRSVKRRLMRQSEGEEILLRRYLRVHGKHLDPTNPQKFTEKLFCRMISLNRKNNHKFTQLADKYSARAYVSSKVGKEHLVKLLWHGKDPNAIPFDSLPAEYVIKTNHSSGQIIVVKGKADQSDVIRSLSSWLKNNYYWSYREYQYFHIKPRVMIEEYLKSQDGSEPLVYRFWCFKGITEVVQVDNYAHDINPFFDSQWNQLDLSYREGATLPAIEKPINFEQMISLASRLSADFDFVRLDLYNLGGKIYFGEFTFTPTAGELQFQPESWDLKLGQKWKMVSEC